MATQGSPAAGRSEMARRIYVSGAALALVAYTNPANSLGDTTVMSDLSQPPLANGYAPISLLPAGWNVVNGVATYAVAGGGDPVWICTAAWGGGITVFGSAVVFGSIVMHFKDNAAPFVALAGKKLAITLADLLGG